MRIIILSLLFASALCAQTVAPSLPAALPDYIIGAGYGVSPSSSISGFKGNQEGWVQGAVKVTPKLYATSTIDFTKTASVMRAGAMYQIANGLALRADGGIAFGTVAIGSFAGGLVYSRPISKSGYSFTTELRVTTNPAGPAGAVNVGIYVGISKGFFKN